MNSRRITLLPGQHMYGFFSIPVIYIICETRPDQQKAAKHVVIMNGVCVGGGKVQAVLKIILTKNRETLKRLPGVRKL